MRRPEQEGEWFPPTEQERKAFEAVYACGWLIVGCIFSVFVPPWIVVLIAGALTAVTVLYFVTDNAPR